jgi:hypothetical protein
MDSLVHYGARELSAVDDKSLCSHVSEIDCPLCVYTSSGSIPESDCSLADMERRTIFQRAYSRWNALHNSMNCYALSSEIASMLQAEFEECGVEYAWVAKINTDLVFQHFVYHDRQRSSMLVLIDSEIGHM